MILPIQYGFGIFSTTSTKQQKLRQFTMNNYLHVAPTLIPSVNNGSISRHFREIWFVEPDATIIAALQFTASGLRLPWKYASACVETFQLLKQWLPKGRCLASIRLTDFVLSVVRSLKFMVQKKHLILTKLFSPVGDRHLALFLEAIVSCLLPGVTAHDVGFIQTVLCDILQCTFQIHLRNPSEECDSIWTGPHKSQPKIIVSEAEQSQKRLAMLLKSRTFRIKRGETPSIASRLPNDSSTNDTSKEGKESWRTESTMSGAEWRKSKKMRRFASSIISPAKLCSTSSISENHEYESRDSSPSASLDDQSIDSNKEESQSAQKIKADAAFYRVLREYIQRASSKLGLSELKSQADQAIQLFAYLQVCPSSYTLNTQ